MSRSNLTGTPLRMTAYAAVLLAAFGAAFAVGAAAEPVGGRGASAGDTHGGNAAHAGGDQAASALPGPASSDAGYTLVPRQRELPDGAAVPFDFTVLDPVGSPLQAYRDLSGFQHVHPSRSADGTWSVPLDLPGAGSYRVFADFAPVALPAPASLQPYLGSFGQLVSLRVGDLAYLRTHPVTKAHDGRTGGPEVHFGAEFPVVIP